MTAITELFEKHAAHLVEFYERMRTETQKSFLAGTTQQLGIDDFQVTACSDASFPHGFIVHVAMRINGAKVEKQFVVRHDYTLRKEAFVQNMSRQIEVGIAVIITEVVVPIAFKSVSHVVHKLVPKEMM